MERVFLLNLDIFISFVAKLFYMNRTFSFFLLIAVCLMLPLFSCEAPDSQIERLDEIREIGNNNPQEALESLESISLVDADKYTRMKYELLKLRLQDKSFIVPVSDERAKKLYAFFIKEGNDSEKQEACYYLASVYRDLHDSPRAVSYFQKALQIAETSEGIDSTMLANTCSQLSSLYRIQYDYPAAMEIAQRGLTIAEQLGIVDPIYLMDVATIAHILDDTSQTLVCQGEALDMIVQEKSANKYADVVCEILFNALDFRAYGQISKCISLMGEINRSRVPHNYYTSMGAYYDYVGRKDSSVYYYRKCYEEVTRISQKLYASGALAKLYASMGDVAMSNEFALKYIEISSKNKQMLQNDLSGKVHNEFVYNRDQAAEARAFAEAERAKTVKTYWAFGFLLLASVSLFVFLKMKNTSLRRANRQLMVIGRMENEIKEHKQIICEKESSLRSLQKDVSKAQSELEVLSIELNEKAEEIAGKNDALEKYRVLLRDLEEELKKAEEQLLERGQMLAQKAEQNEMLFQYAFKANLAKNANDVLMEFSKAAKGKRRLAKEDWRQLFSAIDKLYPLFRSAVLARVKKPTEDKLRIAYLLKAGMSRPQIVNLTGYPTTTVWRKCGKISEDLRDEFYEVGVIG